MRQPGDDGAADPERAGRRRLRWILAIGFGVIVLCAVAGYGWYYFTTARYFESTDDAYTEADNTSISPQISGDVSELRVTDNQHVKHGETLLRIDDRPYKAAVDQAQADVASAEAEIAVLAASSICSNRKSGWPRPTSPRRRPISLMRKPTAPVSGPGEERGGLDSGGAAGGDEPADDDRDPGA